MVVSDSTKIRRNILNRRLTRGKKRESSKTISNLLKEYGRHCTLHGVHYVFRDRVTFLERTVWLSVIILCFICATLLVNTMWVRFSLAPTVTMVKDTHLPLHLFPFPAVTICPSNKIKRRVAVDYISRYINASEKDVLRKILHFLNALSLFQHPYYSRMLDDLEQCKDILPQLQDINITDLMIKVLPTCQELFLECLWHGREENCCDLFSMQRSEEGFCYSFNSLTSEKRSQCETQEAVGSRDFNSMEDSDIDCVLRHNTAAGTGTGMEVYIHETDIRDQLLDELLNTSGVSGVRVEVHHVTEYPEAGVGVLVPSEHGMKMSATIKPSLTQSTDAIRNLAIFERNCYFADEKRLGISKTYTEKSCLTECRLYYLFDVCGCRPYYFNVIDNSIPVCNSTDLICVADHSVELRFFSPPVGILRGFEGSEMFSPLNCSDCLPTCHENTYDVDSDLVTDRIPDIVGSSGYLDIYYKNEGAVKYQRDVTFGWVDLLVSFGGIAGLFLGFSLLSIVELIYWAIKMLILLSQMKKGTSTTAHQIFVQELGLDKPPSTVQALRLQNRRY